MYSHLIDTSPKKNAQIGLVPMNDIIRSSSKPSVYDDDVVA